MKEYIIPAEAIDKIHKRAQINTAITYAFGVVLFSFRINREFSPGYYEIAVVAGLIAFFTACFFWASKRSLKRLQNTKLELNEYCLTISLSPQESKTIHFNCVKKIKVTAAGISLVDKDYAFRSVFIRNSFENFDEIKKIVEEHTEQGIESV